MLLLTSTVCKWLYWTEPIRSVCCSTGCIISLYVEWNIHSTEIIRSTWRSCNIPTKEMSFLCSGIPCTSITHFKRTYLTSDSTTVATSCMIIPPCTSSSECFTVCWKCSTIYCRKYNVCVRWCQVCVSIRSSLHCYCTTQVASPISNVCCSCDCTCYGSVKWWCWSVHFIVCYYIVNV